MRKEMKVVNPPKLSQFHAHTCARCGHEELKDPVWLEGDGVIAAYGSGCATILLFGEDTKKNRENLGHLEYKAKKEFEEKMIWAKYVLSLPEDMHTDAWHSMRVRFNRDGGFEKLGKFTVWAKNQIEEAKILCH
jgi:hypothetical protein